MIYTYTTWNEMMNKQSLDSFETFQAVATN